MDPALEVCELNVITDLLGSHSTRLGQGPLTSRGVLRLEAIVGPLLKEHKSVQSLLGRLKSCVRGREL